MQLYSSALAENVMEIKTTLIKAFGHGILMCTHSALVTVLSIDHYHMAWSQT
jgi:hypothetical protein